MKRFFKQSHGSISVEASIIFGLLIMFIILVSDTGRALINQGKMERLSYSLASVIRERSLYGDVQELVPNEGAQAYRILEKLGNNYIPKNSKLSAKIEALYFDNSGNTRTPKASVTYDYGDLQCSVPNSMEDNANLSVLGTQGKFLSLFRVTVCMEQKNVFLPVGNLVSNIIKPEASSIVLGR